MKKTITLLTFAAFLLSAFGASAQNSIIAQRNDPEYHISESTLISPYKYPQTIECFNTPDERSVFVLSLPNHQTIGMEVSGLYISDMAVDTIHDTLYFCGHTLGETQQGVIGYCSIYDLFYGAGFLSHQDLFYVGDDQDYAVDLTRMLYYRKSNNMPYVAAIGKSNKGYPCLVDMSKSQYGGYIGGCVKDKKESFTDIKSVTKSSFPLTKHYLVTAGLDTSYGPYISLRYYDLDNVFNISGDQDYVNIFSVNASDPRQWLLKDVLVSFVGDNIFSTVSYRSQWTYLGLPVGKYNKIHVAFYDVGALVSHSLFSMVKSIEIPYISVFDAHARLHRYINQGNSDRVVFLQTTPASGNHSSSFCEIDYASLGASGTVSFFGDRDIRLQGLARFNGFNNYIMSGVSVANDHKLMYEMETFGLSSSCAVGDRYNYEEKEPMASIREKRAFESVAGINAPEETHCRKREVPFFIDCTDGERQEDNAAEEN